MTDKPTIEEILALGRVEFETPAGWHPADLGLRNEVIAAALKIHPAEKIHELRDALVAAAASSSATMASASPCAGRRNDHARW